MGVSLESAVGTHEVVERAFAGVAEGRVAEIVGEADGFDEIGIDDGNFPRAGNFPDGGATRRWIFRFVRLLGSG